MEHYKISKLLNDSTASKFVTRKWVEVNNLSSGQYSSSKNIRFKTSVLRSNLCDYSDVYIVVKGRISVRTTENTDIGQKDIAFKNNSSFRSCITKIYSKLTDNAENLDIVMPIEEDDQIIGVSFIITSTKLYVTVVTFSINVNIKFLENIKRGIW